MKRIYSFFSGLKQRTFSSRFLTLALGLFLLSALAMAGCVQQSRGFVLPKGDLESGKDLFVTMSCNQCHSIGDLEWKGEEGGVHIRLGGEVTSIKTYGELVTSVIHPSHEIEGEYKRMVQSEVQRSPMEAFYYNEVMTIEELTDIVTYLQSEYKVVVPEEPHYYTGR